MASVDELKAALKDNLESRGVLQETRASLRAEIFRALDEPRQRPSLSNENLLINELIREYLVFNEYSNAASVLTAESGQPAARLNRAFLARELNIREDPSCQGLPLLYSMLSFYMSRGAAVPRPPQPASAAAAAAAGGFESAASGVVIRR